MPWKRYVPKKKVKWGYDEKWTVNKETMEEDMRELGFSEEEIREAKEKVKDERSKS